MSQILSVMKSVFLIGCAVDRLVSRLTAEYTLKRTHRIPDSAQNGGIRYSHAGQKAGIRMTGEDCMECVFEEPVRAITPGQALVCYQGDYVVGGGVIC